jgi:lipoyl(octanoyl) transferase
LNSILNHKTQIIDLGLIDYKEAWDEQTRLFNDLLSVKARNRNAGDQDQAPTSNYLLCCEHPHVFTQGKSGNNSHLLIDERELNTIGASYYHINRGGDITYHGPGQLVLYPVIDLENFFTDIHRYMRWLEEAVVQTLAEFGIAAGRIAGLTGVWIDWEGANARKICALGVKTSRWVTMHGLAFNVNTDLSYFGHIIPCGIKDKAVTSMLAELGTPQDMELVKRLLCAKVATLFGMEIIEREQKEVHDSRY